jgi:glycosyltransferase involved in cell wall biosynthesis
LNYFHTDCEEVPTISIVTVCLNAESAIGITLSSVEDQSYPLIEHVLIDGGSTDNTLKIIEGHAYSVLVSEKDQGIYYAMQKGVSLATGDIVFFLNSGDKFFDRNVISEVVKFFKLTGADAIFGNLLPYYLNPKDSHDHKAFKNNVMMDLSYFNNCKLFYDESIHHQTIFYKRKIFEKCSFICSKEDANGEYFLNLSAFILHKYKLKHFPFPICKFALGGKSTRNFPLEWENFYLARKILREIFFPNGPIQKIENENEFLYYPPSFKNKMKIYLREYGLYSKLLKLRSLFSRVKYPKDFCEPR